MPTPLTTWTCDTCGQEISRAEDGYVVWRPTSAASPQAGYRIVHKNNGNGTTCDPGSQNGYQASRALPDFLGPDGLAALLAMLSPGPLKGPAGGDLEVRDLDEWVDLVRRVQTPWYEQARVRFQDEQIQQDHADSNETWPYLPDTLRRIAEA